MARREFTKEIKRAALRRSLGKCEAIGEMYGFKPGQRCNAPLSFGVQYDHIIADSIGGEPTLDNCAAVCVSCHGYKTRRVDTPRAAKTKRMSDKAKGIVRPKGAIQSAGFAKAVKPSKALSKPLPPRKRDIFGSPVSEGARA
ncbi:HNH endonuclease [Brucella phage BiPBO1]|uniref:HNH endonuclease n=1 Tax=Brucella phage BiPBO1 TaxID=1718278 RepID=UPI00046D7286|nr:HNH endonuclease signature motif containing protein [Brucella inopinata]YP_009304079.1 HNH endonuclease [Brucella phage BiPBO1]ALJ98265.1 HNH endonuclease [Brucella phage BiPBO1]KEY03801.1 HNH endonuclease [Brucella suis bv. 4 str. 40]